MVKLDKDNLRKLQLAELEMLQEIDRICRKNNINYTLDGGTMLGAVRHGGFIPWDDDADVAMLRAEYNKFYKACRKDLDKERFFLQEFRTDPAYPWGYSKLRRNDSLFLRTGQEHIPCHQGIFVDIFIYDDVPDNFALRNIHLFACTLIRKCQYSVVGKKYAKTAPERAVYSLLDKVPKKFLFEAIRRIAYRTDQHPGELARHMTYPYTRSRYGLPRKCFDEYQDYQFEGKTFRMFKDYDSYLSALYGDYMKLPPEEDRKTHPVNKLKFPGEEAME